MSRADTQRAEPQPPQPFARKRTIEPQRSCFLAAAAACDENRCRRRRKPPKRERKHRGRRRIEPLHVINRDQQRPAAALTEKLERPRTRSPAHPAQTPRPPPAARPPQAHDAAASATARAPPAAPGSRDRREQQTRRPPRQPPDGMTKTAKPCSRASITVASKSVVFPIPASPSSTSAWGVDCPAARKSASIATSTSRPTTRPRSRPAHSSPSERPRATPTVARSGSSRVGTPRC